MNPYESIHYLRERTPMLRTSKTSWNRLRWCLKDLDAVDALLDLATQALASRGPLRHGHVDHALIRINVQADDVTDNDERDAIAAELVRVLEPAIERARASRSGTRRERLLCKVKAISP